MKQSYFITCLCTLLCVSAYTQAKYEYKSGDPNGIDKWYMGRQIAYVMSHQGIDWLERPEREKEENSSQLLKNMNIKREVIADIGAEVALCCPLETGGNGKVYALMLNPR
jgi:hypothetical protein